jgi:antitoxin (DNA-binding transcriptional repressor) of toxin-antitoxin stability system
MKHAKAAQILDIKYVRANLGKLIDALAPREWFIIAVNGVPKVKVVGLTDAQRKKLQSKKEIGER